MKKSKFLSSLLSIILIITMISSPLSTMNAYAANEPQINSLSEQTQVSAVCGIDGLTDVNGGSTAVSTAAAPKFDNGLELRMNIGGPWLNGIYTAPYKTSTAGRDCWVMGASVIHYMAVGVSNTFIQGDGVNPVPVKVDVTYYNGSGQSGSFRLAYNTPGQSSANPSYSDTVTVDGTTGWETHSFILNDAAMNNAFDVSRDFRLSAVSGQICISQVAVSQYIPEVPDDRTQVSAVLGEAPGFDGLTMRMKGDGAWNVTPVTGSALGVSYWSMEPTGDSFFLFGDVDDQFLLGGSNSVAIDVTYYDGPAGFFSLNYNTEEAQDNWSDFVELGRTNQWVTHTFILPDAALNNGCFGLGDFRLGLWTSHGMSPAAVNISQVVVRKYTPEVPENRTQVSAALGAAPDFDGLTLQMKGDGAWNTTPVTGSALGVSYWSMVPAADSFYLFGNVDDQFLYGGSNYVAIDVTYYDGPSGYFSLNYNSEEAQDIWSDFVELGGTNQWVTHSFILPNAALNNGCFGLGDFRLGLWTSHGMSPAAVNISKVVVRKLEKEPAITAEIKSNHIGNIFYNNESYDLSLDLNSDYAGSKDITLLYKIKNNNNLIVMEESKAIQIDNLGTENIPLDFLSGLASYGVFTLGVQIQDDGGNILQSYSFPFSRILSGTDKLDLLGVCTHFGLNRGDADINLPLIANAGIKFIRDEILWQSVEQSKGVYTFKPEWEDFVNTAVANGIEPLIILDYGNPLYENANGPTTDEAVAAYAKYCGEMANHFKGRVKYFEIWNEWNWGTGNNTNKGGDQYGKLVVAASAAIRAANPDAYIIGMALGVTDNKYVADVLSYPGAYEAMDAIAAHPYTFPRKPEGEIEANLQGIRDVFAAKGLEPLPIWMTEMGWPTGTSTYGISDTMSAAYGVRALAWALANLDIVERFFWYDFQNDGTDQGYYEDNFGLVDHWKNLDVTTSAKTGYGALSTFTAKLAGYEFVKSINVEKGIYIYQFKDKNGQKPDILLAWADGLQKTISLNVGSVETEVTDLFGNTSTPANISGKINLFISDTPVYVEGSFDNSVSTGDSSFSLPAQCAAYTGGSFTIDVTRNAEVSGLAGEYQFLLPEGWSINSGAMFEAAPGPGQTTDTIILSVPEGTPDGKYTISLKVVVSGEELLSQNITVTVTTPKVYEVAPYLPNSENFTKWAVAVTINDYSINGKKGTITLMEPVGWGDTKAFDVSMNDSQTLIFDVPETPTQSLYHVKLRVDEEGKPSEIIEQDMSFLAAVKATKPITADGVLDENEWAGAMPFVVDKAEQYKTLSGSWGGIQDLNATGYLKWDEKNLYLAVQAEDDSHYQKATGSNIWQGDGIQFTVDPSRSVEPGFDGYNEIGFALNSDDNQVYNNRWTACQGQSSGQMTDADFGITQDNVNIVYEAAIPWSSITPGAFAAEINKLVGFALVLNDNDSGTRKGYFEYMSGIGAGKDPNLFGDLLLVGSKSNNADLSSITLSNGSLSPAFNPNSTNYTVRAGSSTSINILPIASDSNATIKVNGVLLSAGGESRISLTEGENIINILVTAENGATKNYKLTVIRDVINIPTQPAQPTTAPEKPGVTTENTVLGSGQGAVKLTYESVKENSEMKIVLSITTSDKAGAAYDIPLVTDGLIKQLKDSTITDVDITVNVPDSMLGGNKSERNSIVLPSELLKAAVENEKDLNISVADDNGKVKYSWHINGKDLKNSKQEIDDINLTLTPGHADSDLLTKLFGEDKAPSEVNNVMLIDFAHDGMLASQAAVKIYVADILNVKPGDSIFLYHLNGETGKLETLPYSSNYRVDNDGYITVNIVHCSDYVVMTEKTDDKNITSLLSQIKVKPSSETLYIGGKENGAKIDIDLPGTLEAVKSLKDKTSSSALGGVTVKYESSNKRAATVNSTGKITAVGTGTATISTTVTLYSGKVKVFKSVITVKKPYIEIICEKTNFKIGDIYDFKAEAYGAATEDIVWSTTNKSVIVISKSTGKATAVSKGTDYVVAKVSGVSVKVKVVVK